MNINEEELWLELYKFINNKNNNVELQIINSEIEVQYIKITRTEIITNSNDDDVLKESYIASNFVSGCTSVDCLIDVINKLRKGDWVY